MTSRHSVMALGRPIIFSLTLCAGAVQAQQATSAQPGGRAPSFADFSLPASSLPRHYASRVVLRTPLARRYRTVIAREGRREPDFAGNYRLVTWGCGTDCRGFAIVNRVNGVVYTPPTFSWVAGVMGNVEERIQYRKDSRLLILTGLLDDDEKREGQYFFAWTGTRLKLVFRAPVRKLDEEAGAEPARPEASRSPAAGSASGAL